MKPYVRTKRFRVLAVVAAAFAGTWVLGAVRDGYEVAKMTEKMKTVCVGRMLIDLPEEARVELHQPSIDGFDITTLEESAAAFTIRVAAREAELRAKPDRLGGNQNLESVTEVNTDSGFVGKVFVHGRYVTEGTAAKGLELERYRYEGVALEGHVHAGGISFDIAADKYEPSLVENLPKLIAQLVPNPTNRMTTEPGFCIDRGYFRDPLKADQREQIRMSAWLPNRPDIAINFDTAAGTKPDSQGLLERNAASHARAPLVINLRFTNLRAASRTIGGLTGDELLERVIEENFAIIYGFRWEVLGTKDNVLVPELALTMATGRGRHGPVQSSLSQRAAVDLWDKISSSVRVRPTAPPKVSVADPVDLPMGSYVLAGDSCPRSGWWQCSAGGAGIGVLGGQRQYLKRGQRVPQALLLPPPTWREKLRGLQPSYESATPTAWKLIDKRTRARVAPADPLAHAAVVVPVAIPPVAAADPGAVQQMVAVGSIAATGVPCPASGWWRCEQSEALDGTRWFAQGSRLPAATFAIPPEIFGRSAAAPKAIQRRAAWRLVRYAGTPPNADSANTSAEPDATNSAT